MRMPWVSRARLDDMVGQQVQWHLAASHNANEVLRWHARYDALLEKYHALKLQGAALPEPEKVVPPPKRPPAIVYRAMRAISPRDDATFAANWRLWEENQDECEKDPTAFAERIKRGRMTPEQPRAD